MVFAIQKCNGRVHDSIFCVCCGCVLHEWIVAGTDHRNCEWTYNVVTVFSNTPVWHARLAFASCFRTVMDALRLAMSKSAKTIAMHNMQD